MSLENLPMDKEADALQLDKGIKIKAEEQKQ